MSRNATLCFASCLLVLLLGPLASALGPVLDGDADGIPDVFDSCTEIPNSGALNCDTDVDGFGNVCDGDFDNDGDVDSGDYAAFVADLQTGTDSGIGTNMDCDGVVNANDHINFLAAQLEHPGMPGPSGLPCAGFIPCQ